MLFICLYLKELSHSFGMSKKAVPNLSSLPWDLKTVVELKTASTDPSK